VITNLLVKNYTSTIQVTLIAQTFGLGFELICADALLRRALGGEFSCRLNLGNRKWEFWIAIRATGRVL